MKKSFWAITLAIFATVILQACNGGTDEMHNTDVVSSGTYNGTADKVDPEEQEIYVKTDDDKTLELYFTDQTELTRNGQTVSFDALEEGQKVRVEVEKKGQRLEPISVEIRE